jgi:GT2 family glycosyltransferase
MDHARNSSEIEDGNLFQNSPKLPRASIIIVNTNELHHLKKCLPTLFQQKYNNYEVLIIDNASTDGSLDFVRKEFPSVKVVENGCNLGYAGANNAGFRNATGDYIAVLNPDTRVEPDWLHHLVFVLALDPRAGLATPKILMMDDPSRINTCGNQITYTGLTFCRGLDQSADNFSEPEIVSAVSGAAFVIKRSVLEEIGGFDESFFIYYEDTDLSLRAWLAGYTCIYVPTSVIYHKYAFKFHPRKCFYQERNRYYSLLKTLRWKTLFTLIPNLILAEFIAWGFALLNGPGHLKGKFNSYIWLFSNFNQIVEARRKTQKLRKVDDRIILSKFKHQIIFTKTTNPVIANILSYIINPFAFLIGSASKTIIRW